MSSYFEIDRGMIEGFCARFNDFVYHFEDSCQELSPTQSATNSLSTSASPCIQPNPLTPISPDMSPFTGELCNSKDDSSFKICLRGFCATEEGGVVLSLGCERLKNLIEEFASSEKLLKIRPKRVDHISLARERDDISVILSLYQSLNPLLEISNDWDLVLLEYADERPRQGRTTNSCVRNKNPGTPLKFREIFRIPVNDL